MFNQQTLEIDSFSSTLWPIMLSPPCCYIFCFPQMLNFFFSPYDCLSCFSTFLWVWWFRHFLRRGEVPYTPLFLHASAPPSSTKDASAPCHTLLFEFSLGLFLLKCFMAFFWHLNGPRYIPIYMPVWNASGWSHVSVNHSCSCLSQGPGTLCSHTCTSRRVPERVIFTPNTHSQAYRRAKNTQHHKSRLEHAKVIHRQALLTHTCQVLSGLQIWGL